MARAWKARVPKGTESSNLSLSASLDIKNITDLITKKAYDLYVKSGCKAGCDLDNWVKADAVGGLKEAKGKSVNADQMEVARLKAELAKMRMERDILKKAAVYFARESR